ncbi:MAG: diacylglycerol kinase family protein [Myxococcota bacterium]
MSDLSPGARVASFGHALRGIATLIVGEPHAWFHAVATVAVVGVGVWFDVSSGEWAWLALAIGLVWVAEAFNTALEALADVLHPGHHDGVGRAKDLAAGAVLLAAFTSVAIAGFVFVPRVLDLWWR